MPRSEQVTGIIDNAFLVNIIEIAEGEQNMARQDMPFWYIDYFELKLFKK